MALADDSILYTRGSMEEFQSQILLLHIVLLVAMNKSLKATMNFKSS